MKSPGRFALALVAALLTSVSEPIRIEAVGQDPKVERPTLDMSKAVACKRVEGYDQYFPLPDASLTSEDKLLVYYRPLNYKVEPVEKAKPGHRFKARFSQDGRIRRKGEKAILMKKDNILEYEPFFNDPTERIYLVNTVGLKGLPPGEYEYEIVLRDALEEGSTARQSLPFTILPLPKIDPASKSDEPDAPDGTPGPRVEPKAKKARKKS